VSIFAWRNSRKLDKPQYGYAVYKHKIELGTLGVLNTNTTYSAAIFCRTLLEKLIVAHLSRISPSFIEPEF
jgi:hypothetical protein